jgi:predicted alpha/beta hydrolase
MELIPIHAYDGTTSQARLIRGPSSVGLLILPAMGVNARAYDRFAQSLADAGFTVLVAEHRGGENSSVRPGRGVDFGYAELLADVEVLVGQLRAITSGPVHLLGHSLGGHLAVLGLSRWFEPGSRLVLVASGTVHHRAWPPLQGLGVLVGSQVV